jgi:hypothetical protein
MYRPSGADWCPMAKTPDRRTVVSSWRVNDREELELSLLYTEGSGHLVELPKLHRPLNGGPPREMERGLMLSLAVRHLPAMVAAFSKAEQQARARGLIGGGSNRVENLIAPKSRRRAA